MPQPKSWRRVTALILINVLILFVLLEIVGLLEHYSNSGKLLYADRPQYSTLKTEKEGQTYSSKLLHPYFGYLAYEVGRTLGQLTLNNHGFLSEFGDYPVANVDSNRFIIGVFGGSVAEQVFAGGRQSLKAVLQKHPSFTDKEIVVLSFSQPGYKQPQQLQLLSYFLSLGQHFDLVINLDGFNEIALAEKNSDRGFDFSMPSSGHMVAMMDILSQSKLSPEKVEVLAEFGRMRRMLEWSDRNSNSSVFASKHLLMRLINRYADHRYQEGLKKYESLSTEASTASVYHLSRSREITDSKSRYADYAAYWAKSSMLMHDLLSANNIEYFHFLQPNQYYSRRLFSADESAIAINADHIYRKSAEEGYPYLVLESEELREAGVYFNSGTELFDVEPRPVYADDCCHFNRLGIHLLAEWMAKQIIATEDSSGD